MNRCKNPCQDSSFFLQFQELLLHARHGSFYQNSCGRSLTFVTGIEKEILEGNSLYVQDTNSNDHINVFYPRYIEIGVVIYENNNLYLTFVRVVSRGLQILILTNYISINPRCIDVFVIKLVNKCIATTVNVTF